MKKIIIPILAILGVIGCVWAFPCLCLLGEQWFSRCDHAQLIEHAFNDRLLPACIYIRNFAEREHRLPNDQEMESLNRGKSGWDVVTIIRDRPSWVKNWGVAGRDFIVTTSEPEWNLYYCSWNEERIEMWTD